MPKSSKSSEDDMLRFTKNFSRSMGKTVLESLDEGESFILQINEEFISRSAYNHYRETTEIQLARDGGLFN